MARTRRFDKRQENESASGKGKNIPARAFLTLSFVALVAAWSYTFGVANDFVLALAIILVLIFAVAAATSALTIRATPWILTTAVFFGVVVTAVGIYYRIDEPDGILTPFLIPLGGGIVLAELAVAANRYWNNRTGRS